MESPEWSKCSSTDYSINVHVFVRSSFWWISILAKSLLKSISQGNIHWSTVTCITKKWKETYSKSAWSRLSSKTEWLCKKGVSEGGNYDTWDISESGTNVMAEIGENRRYIWLEPNTHHHKRNVVVAVSCCGDASQQEDLEDLWRWRVKWIQQNIEKSHRKHNALRLNKETHKPQC